MARPELIPSLLTDLRTRAGLTQAQCATMTLAGLRTWKHWEAGTRSMPLAALELWCLAILAGRHLPPDNWCEPWVRCEFMALIPPASIPAAERVGVAASTLVRARKRASLDPLPKGRPSRS